jgi:hypothetical protein
VFAQVVQGRVHDRRSFREQADRWDEEVKPRAVGFLGATGGVAEDGQFVVVARFESAEAAQANSDMPEQGAWWEQTAGLLEGEATFHDCPEVDLILAGGSDDAGFVQVIQGRGDREELRAALSDAEAYLRRVRPELIGALIAWHGDEDGRFTQLAYFTSEAEARRGESRQPSDDDASTMQRYAEVVRDVSYVDLKQPWLSSP